MWRFFLFRPIFLSGRAEWASWACQRMASEGRRNPASKSHDSCQGTLFTLFYYCCLILLTRQGRSVYRWCHNAFQKHTQCLHPLAHGEAKEEMHFTSHVWRLTHSYALIDNTWRLYISGTGGSRRSGCWRWQETSLGTTPVFTVKRAMLNIWSGERVTYDRTGCVYALICTWTCIHPAYANESLYMCVFGCELKARYSWLHHLQKKKKKRKRELVLHEKLATEQDAGSYSN